MASSDKRLLSIDEVEYDRNIRVGSDGVLDLSDGQTTSTMSAAWRASSQGSRRDVLPTSPSAQGDDESHLAAMISSMASPSPEVSDEEVVFTSYRAAPSSRTATPREPMSRGNTPAEPFASRSFTPVEPFESTPAVPPSSAAEAGLQPGTTGLSDPSAGITSATRDTSFKALRGALPAQSRILNYGRPTTAASDPRPPARLHDAHSYDSSPRALRPGSISRSPSADVAGVDETAMDRGQEAAANDKYKGKAVEVRGLSHAAVHPGAVPLQRSHSQPTDRESLVRAHPSLPARPQYGASLRQRPKKRAVKKIAQPPFGHVRPRPVEPPPIAPIPVIGQKRRAPDRAAAEPSSNRRAVSVDSGGSNDRQRTRDHSIPPEYKITGGVGTLWKNDKGRRTFLHAAKKVFDMIRRKGGSLVALDFEGYQQHNDDSVVQTGLVAVKWMKRPDGQIIETREYYHLCSKDYASLRPIAPCNSGTKTEFKPLADIVVHVRKVLKSIMERKLPCLILLHDHALDSQCLKEIFDIDPSWLELFGAPSQAASTAMQESPSRVLDTQQMLAVFARINFKVSLGRGCRVVGMRHLRNLHNATNDAMYTLQLFIKLCLAIKAEEQAGRAKTAEPIIDVDALYGVAQEDDDSDVEFVRSIRPPATRSPQMIDLTTAPHPAAAVSMPGHAVMSREDPIEID